ncbi:hypothetical protein [Streptomyces sp. NPDC127033]
MVIGSKTRRRTSHARRGEVPYLVLNAVLLILAAGVAWGRFGPYAF